MRGRVFFEELATHRQRPLLGGGSRLRCCYGCPICGLDPSGGRTRRWLHTRRSAAPSASPFRRGWQRRTRKFIQSTQQLGDLAVHHMLLLLCASQFDLCLLQLLPLEFPVLVHVALLDIENFILSSRCCS